MLVAPGPLSAVDPTPAPPDGPEMFRLPDDPGTPPRAPAEVAAVGPAGFHDTVVFSGLFSPTAMAFAADGRVFVAEKRGVIKFFDSLSDPSPTVYADLQMNVHDYWDRGLLGLALDPNFTTNGRLYVLYTYNHILGDPDPAPKWVNLAGQDICPNPPGSTTDGCVASARLSRLEENASGIWDGERARPRRGLVPGSPEPFDRDGRLRPGRGPLRGRRGRRQLRQQRLRPGLRPRRRHHARQPVRRSPVARRDRSQPAIGGGRRTSLTGHADER